MLEIAIDELGIGNDKVAYVTLPANRNDVIDAMDREKIWLNPQNSGNNQESVV